MSVLTDPCFFLISGSNCCKHFFVSSAVFVFVGKLWIHLRKSRGFSRAARSWFLIWKGEIVADSSLCRMPTSFKQDYSGSNL